MDLFLQGTVVAIVGQTGPIGHVGPVPIYLFGLTTALGVVAGLAVGLLQAERFGLSLAKTFEFAPWGVIVGVAGARLGYVLTHLRDYVEAPSSLLRLWEGGFSFYGALLGGIVALLAYGWLAGLDFWRTLDAFAPGLALGQAVGLVGAQVLGQATSAPWGVTVQQMAIHPLPAYGIVLTYGLFVALWRIGGAKVRPGSLFLTYLLLHGLGSLFLGLWSSARAFWGMTVTQWSGLICVLLALTLMFVRQNEPLKAADLAGTGVGWGAGAWRSDLSGRGLPAPVAPRTLGARIVTAALWASGLLVLLAAFAARIR